MGYRADGMGADQFLHWLHAHDDSFRHHCGSLWPEMGHGYFTWLVVSFYWLDFMASVFVGHGGYENSDGHGSKRHDALHQQHPRPLVPSSGILTGGHFQLEWGESGFGLGLPSSLGGDELLGLEFDIPGLRML